MQLEVSERRFISRPFPKVHLCKCLHIKGHRFSFAANVSSFINFSNARGFWVRVNMQQITGWSSVKWSTAMLELNDGAFAKLLYIIIVMMMSKQWRCSLSSDAVKFQIKLNLCLCNHCLIIYKFSTTVSMRKRSMPRFGFACIIVFLFKYVFVYAIPQWLPAFKQIFRAHIPPRQKMSCSDVNPLTV